MTRWLILSKLKQNIPNFRDRISQVKKLIYLNLISLKRKRKLKKIQIKKVPRPQMLLMTKRNVAEELARTTRMLVLMLITIRLEVTNLIRIIIETTDEKVALLLDVLLKKWSLLRKKYKNKYVRP